MTVGASASPSTDSPLPDHVPPALTRRFDHLQDPGFLADPFAGFDALYEGPDIFWSTAWGGFWVLTREELIRDVLQNPEAFSSNPVGIPGTPRARPLIPLELDPPDHTWFRRVLAPHFSNAAAERRAGAVREIAEQLVDRFADRGECEFMGDFAQPFPTAIFVSLLGLPHEEAPQFLEWNWTMLHAYHDPVARQAAGADVAAYLGGVVDERARSPRDDLISHMLAAEVHGRSLTRDEVVNMCFLLFLAGLDTVTAALGFCILHLARSTAARRALVADPSLVPAAIEELLRAYPIVQATRTVVADIDLGGVAMRTGDRVLVGTTLASRDPRAHPSSTVVDFDRPSKRNLAFGAGPHRCLGSHLARHELIAAIHALHARVADYRLAGGAELRFWGGGVLGLETLPLVWR
jgi:cytochrome P450